MIEEIWWSKLAVDIKGSWWQKVSVTFELASPWSNLLKIEYAGFVDFLVLSLGTLRGRWRLKRSGAPSWRVSRSTTSKRLWSRDQQARRTVRFEEIGRVFERRLPRTEEELFRRRPVAHWLTTNQVWRTPCSAYSKSIFPPKRTWRPVQ